MISVLLFAAVALCSDYWAGGSEVSRYTHKPPPLNVSRETLRSLTSAAQNKAVELGYGIAYMDLEMYAKDGYYIAYFRPIPQDERKSLGGDLIVIIDRDANVLCFFRGQ
ncbi:MAG TPA: hypothetical protein VL754_01390 [Verrucomicrobiae bacterium]|jgi:hypothetical protein|nr:hypothetical protein [Verrucomicrobiae bacterium]